jgi:TPR repeat protein
MAYQTYLLNTNVLTADMAVCARVERREPGSVVAVAVANARLPLAWLCCFGVDDLRAVTVLADELGQLEVLHDCLLPCTTVEQAIGRLQAAAPLFASLAGDARLGQRYVDDAILHLRALQYPYLTLDLSAPCAVADPVRVARVTRLLAGALAGGSEALLCMRELIGAYHDGVLPLDPDALRSGATDDAQGRAARQNALALSGGFVAGVAWKPAGAAPDARNEGVRCSTLIPPLYLGDVDVDSVLAPAPGWRVGVRGVADDAQQADVVRHLSVLMNCSPAQAESLLGPSGAVVKRGLELANAVRYRRALEECGCRALIEPDVDGAPAAQPLAQAGQSAAQLCLGYQYERGIGVVRDYAAAAAWYRAAAAQGDGNAAHRLAYLVARGLGVAPNLAQAEHQMRTQARELRVAPAAPAPASQAAPSGGDTMLADAASQIDFDAILALLKATRGTPDYEAALEVLQDAANKGHVDAQNELADRYSNGRGVRRDPRLAALWWERAGEQGHVNAQWQAACMFSADRGLANDFPRALRWLEKAAAQGHPRALRKLGALYWEGKRVPGDRARAVEFYKQAAAAGEMLAQALLGDCYAKGAGVKRDYTQACEWFRKAAAQGHSYSQFKLGLLLQEGRGTVRDRSAGQFWLRKAASQGNERALEAMRSLQMAEPTTQPFWKFW